MSNKTKKQRYSQLLDNIYEEVEMISSKAPWLAIVYRPIIAFLFAIFEVIISVVKVLTYIFKRVLKWLKK